MSNIESYIPVILGRPFLARSNALINYRNGMMKLSFGNITLDLNFFNLQRRPVGFNDVNHSILNWVDAFLYDELSSSM